MIETDKFGKMTKVVTQKVKSQLKQKKVSPKEIDDALRSVMNPQQYSDFLVIEKALEDERSAGSRSQSYSDERNGPGWNSSPDSIRLRLVAEAIAERSRR